MGESILDRVKKLCNEQGMSLYELEKKLGFSHGSICKWKKSIPSIDKVQAVAKFFNVPIDYFINEDKE